MEDDFYCTLKLKTGEEIFARVVPLEQDRDILLIVNYPIVITEYKLRTGKEGYKIEPWLKTTTEDLFILNMEDILVVSETNDIEMIALHNDFIQKVSRLKNTSIDNKSNVSRRMGYISSVDDAKKMLENIYKNL